MQLDKSKLTPEQRDKLDNWQTGQDTLQVLQDIAAMTHEVVGLMDDEKRSGTKTVEGVSALLMDMRESLDSLKSKEAPALPNFAKPVVEALAKLEKSLGASLAALDTRPNVSVSAPEVSVAPADMSGIEKAVAQIPKAFESAIKLIPKTEVPETDLNPLLEAWEGISEQLSSIEIGVRLKPQPGAMAISNLSEITSRLDDYDGPRAVQLDNTADPILYIGKAPIGSSTASAVWQISKLDTSSGLSKTWADGDSDYNNIWANHASLTYI